MISLRLAGAIFAAIIAACAGATIGVGGAAPTASAFSEAEIFKVLSAIYSGTSAGHITEVTKSPSEMPAGSTCHYAGFIGGKYVVWLSSSAPHSGDEITSYTAAFALAAMDSGAAGPALKAKYDDAKNRVLLGRAFAEAYQHLSNETRARSLRDIAWVKKTIVVHSSRSTAYELLKKHGLTAFNADYIAGKPMGPNGCSYEDRAQGYWPAMNEPLPKPGCPSDSRQRQFVPNPSATIDFSMGFDIACGSEESLTLMFDLKDELTTIQDSGESQTCL